MRFFIKDIKRIKEYQSICNTTTAKATVMQAIEKCIVRIPEMAQQYNDLCEEFERVKSSLAQSHIAIRKHVNALKSLKAINDYNEKHE